MQRLVEMGKVKWQMKKDVEKLYDLWKEKVTDEVLRAELEEMSGDEELVNDAFYRTLEFGTGGLRGVLGAGTNRMNIYTVAQASQGIADYVNLMPQFLDTSDEKEDGIKKALRGEKKIAISYDSRINSDIFAKKAAEVFAANGIRVLIFKELMPTPCLSYAVRKYGCTMGVMVTASHNPAKYNGYKVYGSDGCQIGDKAATEILSHIKATDVFEDVKTVNFEAALKNGIVQYIPDSFLDEYIDAMLESTGLARKTADDVSLKSDETTGAVSNDFAITYTPLNGTGRKPVLAALKRCGYTDIRVVKEQEMPDGHFPTCPKPNPEIADALKLGIRDSIKNGSELLLATDPDCDRIGIAVKSEKNKGEMELISGNMVGVLLLDYIISKRKEDGTMPQAPVAIKTIVTTELASRIAKNNGVKVYDLLTGFKYIGEKIGELEREGRSDAFLIGFEESYGYLSGVHARDKDAVNAAVLVCDMYVYHRKRGKSLLKRLDEIYATYGYCLNRLQNYEFTGEAGMNEMKAVMERFRSMKADIRELSFGGLKVVKLLDYGEGIDSLPKSNVIKLELEGGSRAVVRPSGTEPKLKAYIEITASDRDKADKLSDAVVADLNRVIYKE